MKKTLSFLLAVCMLISMMGMMSLSVFATESDDSIDIPVEDNQDGQVGSVTTEPSEPETEPSEPETEPSEPEVVGHVHCVCAGAPTGAAEHTCEEITWQPLPEGTTDFGTLASGNYYLTGDVVVTGTTAGAAGRDVKLCLNGHKITSKNSTTKIFGAYKETDLTLTDCSYDAADGTWDGTIYANTGVRYGALIYTYYSTTVNIYGGNYTGMEGNHTHQLGGLFIMAQDGASSKTDPAYASVLNLYNGNVYGGKAGQGANLYAMHAGILNIYGGRVADGVAEPITWSDGGKANGIGGNLYTDGNGAINIYGGEITGGIAANKSGNIGGTGTINIMGGTITDGSVYVTGAKPFTVGGTVTVDELYLPDGKTITVDPSLSNASNIGIAMDDAEAFATGVTADYTTAFTSVDEDYGIAYDAEAGTLSVVFAQHNHCVCGGSAVGVHGHECETIAYTPISDAIEAAGQSISAADIGKLPAGNYFLDRDIISTGGSSWSGKRINICLNGHTISSATKSVKTFGQFYAGAVLAVCDCSGTQDADGNWSWKGTAEGGKSTGTVFNCQANGTAYIYGGNYVGNTATYGGVFNVCNDNFSAAGGSANTDPSLNTNLYIYNANVIGGTATSTGGIINTWHHVNVSIYGGTFTGGTATGNGGSFSFASGTLTLENCTFTDSTSGARGGHIYALGTVILDGVTISGGESKTDGGNIYCSGTLTITDSTVSDGESLSGSGGNIYATKSLSMTNTAVTGGKVKGSGGNVAVVGTGTATITDGTISKGNAGSSGGNLYISGIATVDGTVITEGTCGASGGNIYVYIINDSNKSTFTFLGGEISKGRAMGEAPYAWTVTYETNEDGTNKTDENGNPIIKSAAWKNDVAVGNGGNIWCSGTFTMTGGDIYDGACNGNQGGNIYINGGKSTITGGRIWGGIVNANGDVAAGDNADTSVKHNLLYNYQLLGGSVAYRGGTNILGNVTIGIDNEGNPAGGQVPNGGQGGNLHIAGGTLTIQDGTVIANGIANNKNASGAAGGKGGNINVGGDSILHITGNAIVRDGQAVDGGNILVWDNGGVTISGGTVTGGQANRGGNIMIDGGNATNHKFTISGGTISNGKATRAGGNICLQKNTKTLQISGNTTITGGRADYYGGNIYGNGTVIIDGTDAQLVISEGAASHGGNIYQESKPLTVTKATLENGLANLKTDGTTNGNGGNIQSASAATTTITGCTLTGGVAQRAGNLGVWGKVTVIDTTIEDGSAVFNGGNIMTYGNGELTMTGNNVLTGGTASSGASLSFHSNAGKTSVIGAGAVIEDGEATKFGNGIFLSSGSVILEGASAIESLHLENTPATLANQSLDVSAFTPETPVALQTHQAGTVALADTDKTAVFSSAYELQYNAETGEVYIPCIAIVRGSTDRKWATLQEAIDAAGSNLVILAADTAENVTAQKDLYLDLAGYDIIGSVTMAEGKTLYGMDTTTADYDCTEGYGTIATVNGNVAANHRNSKTGETQRYLTVDGEDGTSFHRFYVGITKVSLKPSKTGFGYKAVFAGDAEVVNALAENNAFTFTLALEGEYAPVVITKAASELVSEKEIGVLLKNFDIENFGETPVNASVCLTLADGTVIEGNEASYSMKTMLQTLNGMLDTLGAAKIQAVQAMCADYTDIVENWEISELLGWTENTEEPGTETTTPSEGEPTE